LLLHSFPPRRSSDLAVRTGPSALMASRAIGQRGGGRAGRGGGRPGYEEVSMRALVYHGPGRKSWDEVPDPVVQDDTDAIVQVDAVTICGTDLHILAGDVPAVTDGRILGHEA